MQTDKVPMLYSPQGIKLSLELLCIFLVVAVKLLDSNCLATFQDTLVDCAGCTKTYYIPLAQVICQSHDIVVRMTRHIHVEDDNLWRSYMMSHMSVKQLCPQDFILHVIYMMAISYHA